METIKKLILEKLPEAVIEDKQPLCVSVEPKQVHLLMETLYNNPEYNFDVLLKVIGMDWGEKLGVIYFLTGSKDLFAKEIVVKTATADRENPLLYSLTDLYETALLNEREIYAMFGIRFINNPDMRKFFLNEDWANIFLGPKLIVGTP